MTLDAIQRAVPSTIPIEQLAIINEVAERPQIRRGRRSSG